MLFKSALVTQISGSVGGMTGSHNRGGMYFRSRAIPTNPNTAAQITARANLSTLAGFWGALSDAQREAWNLYAANVPKINALGDSIYLSGQQWFIAMNTVRVRAGGSLVYAAPTTFAMAAMTLPTLDSASESGEDFDIGFTNTDDWATAADGGLSVQMSRPQGPGVASFKGPFRFADSIDGAGTPPTSPASIAAPFVITQYQKIWARVTAFLPDGRISAPVILGPVIVGA